MKTIIYFVVGTLDEKSFNIKVTELQAKKTAKSFKIEDNKGVWWAKSLVPHNLVETTVVKNQWSVNFNNMKFEAYCEVHNLEDTIEKVKSKIDEEHKKNCNSFHKINESYKSCVIITDKVTKLWGD